MSDFGRRFLVTSFVCVNCGNTLEISYGKPVDGEYVSDGITGGHKVENKIAVYPCKKCYGDAIEPINMIKQALAQINDIGG